MPSDEIYRQMQQRVRQLTAVIGRTPASLRELLDCPFTGKSSSGTVTVTIDFRGTLTGVRFREHSVLAGDEQALSEAIMQAHTQAMATLTQALTDVPADPTTPQNQPSLGRSDRAARQPSHRPTEPDNFEETRTVLRR